MDKAWWICVVLLAGCGGAGHPIGGGDAGLDGGLGDVGVRDAGPDAGQDAGPDAGSDGGEDAGPECGPLATYAGDAGEALPGTSTGGSCARDLDCPAGQFCYLQHCVSPTAVGDNAGPGTGGHLADGGACQALELPSTCDAQSLAWSASLDLSRDAGSFVESDQALASNGQGRIVAAWSSIIGQHQVNLLAASADDGLTFAVAAAPLGTPGDEANDSQLWFAPDAGFVYAWEEYGPLFSGAQHVFLAAAPDGVQWSPPQQVDAPGDFQTGGALDFPWVGVNPASGVTYLTYNVTPASETAPFELRLAVAVDGGFAYSELDDGTRPHNYRDLATGAFDQAGSFYVVWFEEGNAQTSLGGVFSGATGNAVELTRFDPSPAGLVQLASNVQVSEASDAVAFDAPRLAVAPDGSALYAAYVAGTDNATNIEVRASADRGATWGAPVQVNDDATCATHFKPVLALDAQGRLFAFWYDNRDGLGHLFYAVSIDGAATFGPNRLVSDAPFPFSTFQFSSGWLGDYWAVAVAGQEIDALWNDPREGEVSHAFFAKAPLP